MNERTGTVATDERPLASESGGSEKRTRSMWRRLATVALGGVLLAQGLKRRSITGSLSVAVGGWLCYRGLVGGPGPETANGPTGGIETGRDADGSTTTRSITVDKPASELSRLWRDPEQLDRIVGPAASVTDVDGDRQRWTVRGPFDRRFEWEMRVDSDRSDDGLRWETVDGALVPVDGTVRFRPAPGDRGTEVTLRLQFDPPGGAIGAAALERLGFVPDVLVDKALYRFKSLAEAGEIPTLAHNPSARGSGDVL